MKISRIMLGVVGTLCLGSLISCDSEGQLATVQVQLIDAPADYDAVNIDIQDVQINLGEEEDGWRSVEEAQPGIYNLLELTNGASAFLGEIALPAGELGQVRLILGDNNTLVTEGDTLFLSTPSAQQSGLKVKVNQEIQAGVTYQLIIDFDAARSVVAAGGSGRYNLKPVLRATMDPVTGAISGLVEQGQSEGVGSAIYAMVDADTITTTYTDDTGNFLLSALPEGLYTVSVVPESESVYTTTTVTGVSVVAGQVNDIGTVKLLFE